MRYLLLFIVLALCSCKYLPNLVIPAKQVTNSSEATVALVYPEGFFAKEEGQQWVYCAGSFISQYEVLTANHCVTDIGDKIRVGTYSDYVETDGTFKRRKWTEFLVVKKLKDADLALLRVVKSEKASLPNHTVFPLGDHAPVVGEQVYVVGHPNGLLWTYTVGIVSSPLRMLSLFGESRKFFQHQAPVYKGNSGGPVLSLAGAQVGVASLYTPAVGQLNLSVHLDEIKQFLVRE